MPKMMTLQQAATETGLTYSCLRRVKAGNRYLVNMERLAEFLDTPVHTGGAHDE